MKRIIVLLSLLLIVACSNNEKNIENNLVTTKVVEEKEVLDQEELGSYDKKDIRGKKFSNNSKDKYYFTFLEDSLLVSVPAFGIEKKLDCYYEEGSFVVEIFTGQYLEGKNESDKITSVESFFLFKILDSISQEKSYIDKENHIATFKYEYILEKKLLRINPNSSNQILFTQE